MTSEILSTDTAPVWILLALTLTFLTGFVTLIWGRRLPRQGDWLVGVGLLGMIAAMIVDRETQLDGAGSATSWLRGWVWPRQEDGAILIGIVRDSLGASLAGLSALLCGIVAMNRNLILKERRPERVYAAAAFGCCGISLAWLAATPWLAFFGLVLTTLAGFVSLSTDAESEMESKLAARFGREHAWGLLFAILGACAISSYGTQLSLNFDKTSTSKLADFFGAELLLFGLFLEMQPFPLFGWLVMPSRSLPATRLIFGQIVPACAAFAALARLTPQLKQMGLFPGFGWIALASAVLATLMGLLQRDWRLAFGAWISSAFSVAVAALAFSGAWSGTAIALGVLLGGSAFALAASAQSLGVQPQKVNEKNRVVVGADRSAWVKATSLAAACAGTGMIGFVSSGGFVRWIMPGLSDPMHVAVFALVLFLSALLLWKLAWTSLAARSIVTSSWASIVPAYLLLLLAFGFLWTGTLSGGAIPGDPDRVATSALDVFFVESPGSESAANFLSASWLHWGALVLAMATAYWSREAWQNIHERFPKVAAFFEEGYAIDRAGLQASRGVDWAGRMIHSVTGQKLWGKWMPSVLTWLLQAVGRSISQVDTQLSHGLNRIVRRSIDIPAKFLQMIQSGDVQWYLFFALGTGMAILVRFLNFK